MKILKFLEIVKITVIFGKSSPAMPARMVLDPKSSTLVKSKYNGDERKNYWPNQRNNSVHSKRLSLTRGTNSHLRVRFLMFCCRPCTILLSHLSFRSLLHIMVSLLAAEGTGQVSIQLIQKRKV